ncbi:hypothetical protein GLOIN_2v1720049 [Rhizophagus clarus]|uniref:Uncharacterized protein n=1 Tax=Rhizophagus clarus TaxID=94130 RepID=A0A8H3MCR8_9GLOM|nr:hypothetical protein GLOIN_2v1720049 [Rhizophagus clarus]
MDYFATKYETQIYPNRAYKWKLCTPILRLLMDTGGLSRALEQLLITYFKILCDGKTFFQKLESYDYDNIYTIVKEDLQRMYNIYDDVKRNPYLYTKKLLYYYVKGIPVTDTLCLDENNTDLTMKNLQQNGHTVLFLCSSIKMGITDIVLEQLYSGTYGINDYLQLIHINLKKLSICKSNEQFLATKRLISKSDNKPIDLKSENGIVLNDVSANSREITEKAVNNEDIKNLNVLNSNVKNMYEGYELITVVFTTQPYDRLKEKTGVLIISKDNFDKHFGLIFSLRAIFSITKVINPNFWNICRLKNTLEDIDKASIDDIISKRPYNEDQYYEANPRAKR